MQCSDNIKTLLARSCVFFCRSSIPILLPAALAIANCFALKQTDFDRAADVEEVDGASDGGYAHHRDIICESMQSMLNELMSVAAAAPHPNILSCATMLSLLRQIENHLLVSVFNLLLRSGNDSACRFAPATPTHPAPPFCG